MLLSSELITVTLFKCHSGCCRGQERKQGDPVEVRHQPRDHPPSNRDTQEALLSSSA